jgi:micrococcal nuclease
MVSIVWLGSRNINLEMVREGYAEAYRKYLKEPHQAEFLRAEEAARGERRGIWGISGNESPGDFRERMRVRGF